MSQRDDDTLPVWRLNLLRAIFALMAIGLTLVVWPSVLRHGDDWAIRYGDTQSLLAAIGLLSWFGIRYPLQMLPLMVFELAWKAIWMIFVALPLYWHDQLQGAVLVSAWEIGLGLILIPPVLPWRYLYHHYVRRPSERWR